MRNQTITKIRNITIYSILCVCIIPLVFFFNDMNYAETGKDVTGGILNLGVTE